VTHDEIADDAVDREEAQEIEAHLASCPRCAAELAEHHEMAGLLSGVGAEAPRGLWDAIAAQTGAPRELAGQGSAPIADLGQHRAARSRPKVGWAMRLTIGVAAVAVALALIAGVQIHHLDGKVNQLTALSRTQGISQAVQSALLNPDVKRIALTGNASSGATAAELVVLPSGTSFLVNSRLEALPGSETYQLWGIIDGRAISLGVLGAHPSTVPFTLDASSSLTAFAITAERAGGVVVSTHTPVAEAKVTQGEISAT
jgi:anti-sigma factor RsiW